MQGVGQIKRRGDKKDLNWRVQTITFERLRRALPPVSLDLGPMTQPSASHGGTPLMLMRGGTSKGLFFLAKDVPADPEARDHLLLSLMGSPDPRQIDGLGGANPLTSKVAIVDKSSEPEADINYLFLQVAVDEALVSDRQNCGNMVAAVAPFALERGLLDIPAKASQVTIRIRLLNTGGFARATVLVRDGRVCYEGSTTIAGVPGTAAPIGLDFSDTVGSSCGSLLPSGSPIDEIAGVPVTMIDNGMPVVLLRAVDLGITGHETPAELDANIEVKARVESIRLQAGMAMNLGDVGATTVPKMTIVSASQRGAHLNTRTFIPHRCHQAIGVLGAVSVATAIQIPDTIASRVAGPTQDDTISLEHPTGQFLAKVSVSLEGGSIHVERSGIVRTARKIMDGIAFPREI